MSFFKKFRISGKDAGDSPRLLEHPRDLAPNDLVKFDLAGQSEISNKRFTVERLWALSTGEGDLHKRIYFGLDHVGQKVRLRVVNNDEIEVAIELLSDEALQIFKQDDLMDLLESQDEAFVLKRKKEAKVPEGLLKWTTGVYRREGFLLSYRFQGDFRDRPVPTEAGSDEQECDFHLLVSDDRKHSVEFRVFDGGRTEVHLCLILPRRKIEALWPSSQSK